jgi:glycine cleavage system H protein
MTDFLQFTSGKFIFRTATDRLYTPEGLWAKPEAQGVRIGISDFTQQRSGDIAFAEPLPEGSHLSAGDEVVNIETIKVDVGFSFPVKGVVSGVNAELRSSPELINQDPYGKGWLALIQVEDWESHSAQFLSPEAFQQITMKLAEDETRNS